MRLPRPRWRFRLRTLMIAVAVAAALFGSLSHVARIARMAPRAKAYRMRAAQYERYLRASRSNVALFEALEAYWAGRPGDSRSREKIQWCRVYARQNRELAERYAAVKRK